MCEHDVFDPSRRQILRICGGLGALALTGCNKSSPTEPTLDEGSGDTGDTGGTGGTENTGGSSCVVTPELTEGPFFDDGTLDRANIVAGQPGLPLQLNIGVYDASSDSCAALEGVQIELWHANATGDYSAGGTNYLRGHQITNAEGMVLFTTIYPGWYQGRTTHIHLKARIFDAAGTETLEATTQIFFDDSITDQVYQVAPYNTRGARDTRNAQDGIYPGSSNLVGLSGSATSMYIGSFSVGVVTT